MEIRIDVKVMIMVIKARSYISFLKADFDMKNGSVENVCRVETLSRLL